MEKREFLKLSSVMLASPFLSPFEGWLPGEPLLNWAGNIRYSTDRLALAGSTAEAAALIRKHPKLKVLGTRHCFNTIADSSDQLLNLPPDTEAIRLDTAANTVTVDGGIKYGQLAPWLHSRGYALHNLASLPHISVAGACATATHGSGVKNGNLATAVQAMTFLDANGDTHTLSRAQHRAAFDAAVVHLGALGVVTRLTLAVEPTFMVAQRVYENLPMAQLKDHFEAIMGTGYSVSLFTDWQQNRVSEVWVKSRVGTDAMPGDTLFGATAATRELHPIAAISAEHCTAQLGVPGPWYERLPHFRMGFTPSSGKELQSEFFVPRQHSVEAILALERMRDQITPHLLISEVRTIDADTLWMSPCYQQASTALHFTWKPDWPAVRQLLPRIEQELAPFGARPHWGKLFTLAPAVLQQRYPKFDDFRALARRYDPAGKFKNDFLTRNLYGN